MRFESYTEFYEFLQKNLPDWEIVFGTSKDSVNGKTCFINQDKCVTTSVDDVKLIQYTTYDLIFLQERAAFYNTSIVEQTIDGVRFIEYNDDSGMNIFVGSVIVWGPRSLPDE